MFLKSLGISLTAILANCFAFSTLVAFVTVYKSTNSYLAEILISTLPDRKKLILLRSILRALTISLAYSFGKV